LVLVHNRFGGKANNAAARTNQAAVGSRLSSSDNIVFRTAPVAASPSRRCSVSYTQTGAQIQGNDWRDLSQVVAAWGELPAALKAAILAIVDTAANKGGQ
jgi:hypothetical protein